MKKPTLRAIIVQVMFIALLITSCGNKETTETISKSTETVKTENTIDVVESEVIDDSANEATEDAVSEEPEYTENESFYLWNDAGSFGGEIDLDTLELTNAIYTLEKSVDIYCMDTSYAGYTKEGIEVEVLRSNDEWSFCGIDSCGYLIKNEELLAAIAEDNEEVDIVKEETSTPVNEVVDTSSEPITETRTTETPAETAVESNKYTPEEAISVYRSLMEAGGITWDPSIKDVTSWGTGWIYLEKGMPEWCASTDLESFAMGDTTGNPCTEYYLEVTGSDENAVYITEWHD